MLAEALFKRIDVRGFRDVYVRLTDEAIANGFGAVLPEQFGIPVNGRGERNTAVMTDASTTVRFVPTAGPSTARRTA